MALTLPFALTPHPSSLTLTLTQVPLTSLYHRANPLAVDLLEQMLAFTPSMRISAAKALEHEYAYICRTYACAHMHLICIDLLEQMLSLSTHRCGSRPSSTSTCERCNTRTAN